MWKYGLHGLDLCYAGCLMATGHHFGDRWSIHVRFYISAKQLGQQVSSPP
jgi:hypothetical protein